MTLAIDHAGTTTRERRRRAAGEVKWQTRSFRLFVAGFMALLAGAWGGIVPFVGPTFGFSADGSGSWYWDLSHTLLALIPGAVGCLVGFSLMGYSISRSRSFLGLGLIGLLAAASGAWFVIGPFAWPVLYSTKAYFVTATPLRELAYLVGYALGPGLILAIVGGVAWGSETARAVAAYEVEAAHEIAPARVGATAPVAADAPESVAVREPLLSRDPIAVPEAAPGAASARHGMDQRNRIDEVPPAESGEDPAAPPNEDSGGATMPA